MTQKNQILRRIYPDILIGPTSGQKTIATAGDLFTSWIDPKFINWRTSKPSGKVTLPTNAELYGLSQEDTSFGKMFGLLGNIDDLCWEDQEQILVFCCKYHTELTSIWRGTFFPFKVEGEDPFVADIYSSIGGLAARLHRSDSNRVWRAEDRHCLVIPQQLGNN